MLSTGKHVTGRIDGTPEKRLFLSIISDYDLKTGLFELIDNAIDLWTASGHKTPLRIDVSLDHHRQVISVQDNAGGVAEKNLRLLITPGASSNTIGKDIIGTFGVGGKRAGVALGELVEIKTRFRNEKSVQLDINPDWIKASSWDMDVYEVAALPPNTTSVEISKLRQPFLERDVDVMNQHIGETYAWFLEKGCEIFLNAEPVAPLSFDNWAYPPDFLPRSIELIVEPAENKGVAVTITAGLIQDRDPVSENYGVYVYCNNRLITKELRTRDVGYFVTSEAGVPHPDASLCRVVVRMLGPADVMPWNSSKSGLNFSHLAFTGIRPRLIELVGYYSKLSRRLKNDWGGTVFSHQSGAIETIPAEEILSGRRMVLPDLPRVRATPRIGFLKEKNKRVVRDKPWTLGLLEAMGLVDLIAAQNLETKNRAALILLDSNFEIALKEFIVNSRSLFPPHRYDDAKITLLFKARHSVINEVKAHVDLPDVLLDKVSHFYNLRNKLVHERATVGITDQQIVDYRATIEAVLKKLFGLKFPKQK